MNQALEYLNAQKVTCKASNPVPSTAILINGEAHAGVVTHVCTLEDKHKDLCRCKCGSGWKAHK